MTYWVCIGLAVAVVFGTLLGVGIAASNRPAAPPPGGFPFEQVVDARAGSGSVKVYRFRDGPRVCYVAAADGAADTIACTVSP